MRAVIPSAATAAQHSQQSRGALLERTTNRGEPSYMQPPQTTTRLPSARAAAGQQPSLQWGLAATWQDAQVLPCPNTRLQRGAAASHLPPPALKPQR